MPTCGGIGTYLPNYHTMQVSGQGKNTTLHFHQWTHHCDQIIVDISGALFTLLIQFENENKCEDGASDVNNNWVTVVILVFRHSGYINIVHEPNYQLNRIHPTGI